MQAVSDGLFSLHHLQERSVQPSVLALLTNSNRLALRPARRTTLIRALSSISRTWKQSGLATVLIIVRVAHPSASAYRQYGLRAYAYSFADLRCLRKDPQMRQPSITAKTPRCKTDLTAYTSGSLGR